MGLSCLVFNKSLNLQSMGVSCFVPHTSMNLQWVYLVVCLTHPWTFNECILSCASHIILEPSIGVSCFVPHTSLKHSMGLSCLVSDKSLNLQCMGVSCLVSDKSLNLQLVYLILCLTHPWTFNGCILSCVWHNLESSMVLSYHVSSTAINRSV